MTDLASGTTLVSLTANVTAARVAAPELPIVRVEKGIAVRFSELSALKKLRHRRMDSNSVVRTTAKEASVELTLMHAILSRLTLRHRTAPRNLLALHPSRPIERWPCRTPVAPEAPSMLQIFDISQTDC